MFIIRERDTQTVLYELDTLAKAENRLKAVEKTDLSFNLQPCDFYEIVEINGGTKDDQ